jgi:acetolactate synthase-1/2/3 large subunit
MTELDAQSRTTDQAAAPEEPEPRDEPEPGLWGETDSPPPAPAQPDVTDMIREAFEGGPDAQAQAAPEAAPAEPADERAPDAPAADTEAAAEAALTEAVAESAADTAPAEAVAETADTAPAEAVAETADDAPPVEVVAADGPRTVGRFIADALRTAGVRYAFTVPGESFLGLLDAFEGAGIRVIATRHEGAAAFMAEAHGQLTGRPAVCLGTRAVGGSNLAIGIHTAKQNSTPLFAVVGQVERSLLGREAFQEIDQVGTLGGLAKWASEPHTAADIAAAVPEAVRQALGGRPGPVLLSLPEDLLDEPMPDEIRADAARSSLPRASDEQIRAVIELLASARRPVILAGAGILRARTSTELIRFAELLQVPIVASWRRADVISNDHALYLGMAGLGAPQTVRERLDAADALVVIGSRLNELTSYGYTVPRADLRWAHIDLAPGRPVGLPAPELAIASDAKAFLRAANERLVGRAVLDAELVAARQASNVADRAAWEASSVVDAHPWDGPGVHPGRTVATLRRVLPDDAILTTDAGNFAGWAGRGFRFRRPGTFLGTTSGAMGYGLPAAIAASLVHRDRAVVALVGDGGLGMTMAELETAVRIGARVVVVVFDNERYGTIRMWQEQRGTGVGVGTELGPVDFAAIGRACGARGVRIDKDSEFEAALRTALAADRPTVIQLTLDRRWVSVDQPPA